MEIETIAWQHEETGMICQIAPGINPGERWSQIPSDKICKNCGQVHGERMGCIGARLLLTNSDELAERITKIERWREQVSRYLPGESDCNTCRFARVEGSRDTSGGNEAQGYDQTGCDQPLLLETYRNNEPAGMLLEGLMIKQAESGAGLSVARAQRRTSWVYLSFDVQ